MAKKNDNFYRRVLIFVHIILVLAVLSSGSLAGLYFSQPFVHMALKHPQDSVHTWHLRYGSKGSVLAGGHFTTTIAVYNTSIFPITYEPQSVDLYYYPIGERPSCLFLHSDDKHFDPNGKLNNISKVYNTIDSTSETFFKLNDLKVTLKSSRWDFTNPKYYELHWDIGFEVPSDQLDTIKQLYIDCDKFDKILFSMRLKDIDLNYLFMTKRLKSTFELLIPMSCSVDHSTRQLFARVGVKREPVLFGELEHKTISFDPDHFRRVH